MSAAPPPPTDSPYSTERARATVAVCVVFVVLATLAVIARFWARRLKGTEPALDDWLVIGGLIFYYLSAIATILQVSLGRLGHHLKDGITPDQLIIQGKLGTYAQYAYALTMGFIRWSICSLLYRIFITKGFRRAILACNIVNVLWILFSILIVSFRCIPFSKNWAMEEPGTCLAQVPIVSGIAAWGLAIELTIWCLPIPATWALQMPRSNKIAVTLIFGLGIFDIGVGIGRLVTVLQVQEADFTWTEVPALEWLAIEPSIAIIVACLCVCKPLLDKLLPKGWHKTFGSKTFGSSGPFNSGSGKRLGDDQVELVSGKNGTGGGTSQSTVGRGPVETLTEREGMEDGNVYVRRDIIVSAHDKV